MNIPEKLIPYLERAESSKSLKRYRDLGFNTDEVSICSCCCRKFRITMFPTKRESFFHDDYNISCRYCVDVDGVRCWQLTNLYYKQSIPDKRDEMAQLREDYFDAPVITSTGELDGLAFKWASHLTKSKRDIVKPTSELKVVDILERIDDIEQQEVQLSFDKLTEDVESGNLNAINDEIDRLKKEIASITPPMSEVDDFVDEVVEKEIGRLYSTTAYNRVVEPFKMDVKLAVKQFVLKYLTINPNYKIDGSIKSVGPFDEEYWILPNENEQHLAYIPFKDSLVEKSATIIQKPVHALAKTVSQYTLEGDFVKRYSSLREAEESTGVQKPNISLCCHGKLNSAGGFRWLYDER